MSEFRPNRAAFKALRTSPAATALAMAAAEKIASAANASITNGTGSDYKAIESRSPNRARAVVVTTNGHAIKHEAKTGVMVRGLAGG